MNVVDSSGWLEYFADGPQANFFAPPIESTGQLLIPVICVYEVFKNILQQRSEHEALQAMALMQQGRVVDLTSALSMDAAKISFEKKLPMADSIILATAWAYQATLWTQDSDFEGLSSVKFARKINS